VRFSTCAGCIAKWLYVIATRVKSSGEAGSTRVALDHSGFPEEMHEHLGAGWHRMYWEPLKKLLAP